MKRVVLGHNIFLDSLIGRLNIIFKTSSKNVTESKLSKISKKQTYRTLYFALILLICLLSWTVVTFWTNASLRAIVWFLHRITPFTPISCATISSGVDVLFALTILSIVTIYTITFFFSSSQFSIKIKGYLTSLKLQVLI